MKRAILFFPTGATAVFHDEEQVPHLQVPWIVQFARMLEAEGVDPTLYRCTLPDGREWEIFRTEGDSWLEYNWRPVTK